jgi:hypothetical protein
MASDAARPSSPMIRLFPRSRNRSIDQKSVGAEGEKAGLGEDLNRDAGGFQNREAGRGIDRCAGEVGFGEGRNEEAVGERGTDDTHVAGEERDPGERANRKADSSQGVNRERKDQRENDQDEKAMNDSIGGADADNGLQRFETTTTRRHRMMTDGDEHQQRGGAEHKTGDAFRGPARKTS